ncbi:hypothetical protein HBI07_247310 [Parastagonospora nodorum]|nr:hypothetical protein HBI07_247310 [Parastagonospora nodorum]
MATTRSSKIGHAVKKTMSMRESSSNDHLGDAIENPQSGVAIDVRVEHPQADVLPWHGRVRLREFVRKAGLPRTPSDTRPSLLLPGSSHVFL